MQKLNILVTCFLLLFSTLAVSQIRPGGGKPEEVPLTAEQIKKAEENKVQTEINGMDIVGARFNAILPSITYEWSQCYQSTIKVKDFFELHQLMVVSEFTHPPKEKTFFSKLFRKKQGNFKDCEHCKLKNSPKDKNVYECLFGNEMINSELKGLMDDEYYVSYMIKRHEFTPVEAQEFKDYFINHMPKK